MRVISGIVKGRKLSPPDTKTTRPTADNVKEAMFSIIGERVGGARVLDLFAGSGALGIEALSRGAAHCCFVDGSADAVRVIYTNVQILDGIPDISYDIHKAYAQKFLKKCGKYDIIILDPPYGCGDIYKVTPLLAGAVCDGGCVVYEHGRDTNPPRELPPLKLYKTYTYGIKSISFYT